MKILKLILIVVLTGTSAPAHDTWENRAGLLTGSNVSASHATYIGGRFIMTNSSSSYWHSVAGTAGWTNAFLPDPSGFSSRGIATDGNTLVISGTSNSIYTTTAASVAGLPTTAITWTKRNPAVRPLNVNFGRVRYLNGQFILTTSSYNDQVDFNANSYTELLTSPDGETWTSRKFMASALGNTNYTLVDIAFKPGA
jgi:hypothetical protein